MPIGYAIYLGFTNLELVGLHSANYWWTGLTNLRRMAHDTVFWHSVRITVVFLVGSAIVGQSLLGLVLALLMRRALAPIRLSVGAIVVGAWVLPEITAALVWYAFSQAHGTHFAFFVGDVFGNHSVPDRFDLLVRKYALLHDYRSAHLVASMNQINL